MPHVICLGLTDKKDAETRAEIERLRDIHAVDELERRLNGRIQFGTAGLRGRMAAGFACMNSLTVIQASQGLAKFLTNKHPERAKAGVIIGHDSRRNSAKFAALAANAFIAEKIPVWHFDQPSITPLVPFAVAQFGTVSGVMVTASHVR